MNERHKFKSGFKVAELADLDPEIPNIVTETFDRDEKRLKDQLTKDARLLAGEIERGEGNAPRASERILNA